MLAPIPAARTSAPEGQKLGWAHRQWECQETDKMPCTRQFRECDWLRGPLSNTLNRGEGGGPRCRIRCRSAFVTNGDGSRCGFGECDWPPRVDLFLHPQLGVWPPGVIVLQFRLGLDEKENGTSIGRRDNPRDGATQRAPHARGAGDVAAHATAAAGDGAGCTGRASGRAVPG